MMKCSFSQVGEDGLAYIGIETSVNRYSALWALL
jgi:hypothetical protein